MVNFGSAKTEQTFAEITASDSRLPNLRKKDKTLATFGDSAMGEASKHITARVLAYWVDKGLAPNTMNGGWRMFSAVDIAQIQILVVLGRRGWGFRTLIKIKDALLKKDRNGISFLEAAACYVNDGTKIDDLYLVINGNNKCFFALADDLPELVKNDKDPTPDSPHTFSHTILNLNRIITEMNLMNKISRGAEHFAPARTRGRK